MVNVTPEKLQEIHKKLIPHSKGFGLHFSYGEGTGSLHLAIWKPSKCGISSAKGLLYAMNTSSSGTRAGYKWILITDSPNYHTTQFGANELWTKINTSLIASKPEIKCTGFTTDALRATPYEFKWTAVIIPNQVPSDLFVQEFTKAINNRPYGLKGFHQKATHPIYVNDHNYRNPIYDPQFYRLTRNKTTNKARTARKWT